MLGKQKTYFSRFEAAHKPRLSFQDISFPWLRTWHRFCDSVWHYSWSIQIEHNIIHSAFWRTCWWLISPQENKSAKIILQWNNFWHKHYIWSGKKIFDVNSGSDILTLATMKSSIFWNVTPCSKIDISWCAVVTYCLRLQCRRTKQTQDIKRNESR